MELLCVWLKGLMNVDVFPLEKSGSEECEETANTAVESSACPLLWNTAFFYFKLLTSVQN
nr:hypothetical protein Iba_chr10dCG1950 [Ipomoea batatas]